MDKDLFLSRRKREFLQKQYFELYEKYVIAIASLDLKDKEITEANENLEKEGKKFSQQESDLLNEINRMAAEHMELAIKNKHLERELESWQKGKKTVKPARRKKVEK